MTQESRSGIVTDMASGEDDRGGRAAKSAAAFRTISEVSETIEVPQHVLRFWETKFSQIRPLKRGGGRRYYRPEDVELLRRIRALLYNEGYTIKGAQRLLRNGRGVKSGQGARQDARQDEDVEAGNPAGTTAADPVPPRQTPLSTPDASLPPARPAAGTPDRDAPTSGATDRQAPDREAPDREARGDAPDAGAGDSVRLAEVEAAVRQEFGEIRAEIVALREMLRRRLG